MVPRNVTSLYSIEQNGLNYGREFLENLFFDNRYS
jgi:hypothetical protein